jgi:uncharacterized membrane protein YphA (DoxX/SURF4 family)
VNLHLPRTRRARLTLGEICLAFALGMVFLVAGIRTLADGPDSWGADVPDVPTFLGGLVAAGAGGALVAGLFVGVAAGALGSLTLAVLAAGVDDARGALALLAALCGVLVATRAWAAGRRRAAVAAPTARSANGPREDGSGTGRDPG